MYAALYPYRFVLVVALLVAAVVLLTDKNRLPPAFRGLNKMLGRTLPADVTDQPSTVRPKHRVWAFVLILVAFLVAAL